MPYLVKNFHFQQALVMAPETTLPLAVSHTPRNFICLKMPPNPDVLKLFGLLFDDHFRLVLVMVLHGERLRTEDGVGDDDRPALVANNNASLVGCHIDVAAQHCLCCKRVWYRG